jgi:outer membrane protein W
MKTKITTAMIAFFLIGSIATSNAQTSSKSSDDKCVKKGTFIADGFYGYPYILGRYVKEVATTNNNNNTSDNIRVFNLNHLGGKAEYMLTDVIGLGVEYTFAATTAKYTESYQTYLGNNVYSTTTNDYTARIVKQRILAKINFHFATSKVLDPYATAGIGYKTSLLTSNNPNDAASVSDINDSFLNFFPVAFRVGAGLRYYFLKNVGVGIEAGIGGPIIQGGISIKI